MDAIAVGQKIVLGLNSFSAQMEVYSCLLKMKFFGAPKATIYYFGSFDPNVFSYNIIQPEHILYSNIGM